MSLRHAGRAAAFDVHNDMATLMAIVTAIPAPHGGVLSSRKGQQDTTIAASQVFDG
jgi:hypothetical protein